MTRRTLDQLPPFTPPLRRLPRADDFHYNTRVIRPGSLVYHPLWRYCYVQKVIRSASDGGYIYHVVQLLISAGVSGSGRTHHVKRRQLSMIPEQRARELIASITPERWARYRMQRMAHLRARYDYLGGVNARNWQPNPLTIRGQRWINMANPAETAIYWRDYQSHVRSAGARIREAIAVARQLREAHRRWMEAGEQVLVPHSDFITYALSRFLVREGIPRPIFSDVSHCAFYGPSAVTYDPSISSDVITCAPSEVPEVDDCNCAWIHTRTHGVLRIPEAYLDRGLDRGHIYEDEGGDYWLGRPRNVIAGYHSSKDRQHLLNPPLGATLPAGRYERTTTVGVELEVEVHDDSPSSRETLARQVIEKLRKSYADVTGGSDPDCAFVENDGSLGNGFEIITSYGPLDTIRGMLLGTFGANEAGKLPYARKLNSHDTRSCGLHVHLDMPRSLLHLGRLVEFYCRSDNAELLKAVARRYSVNYARINGRPTLLETVKTAKAVARHSYDRSISVKQAVHRYLKQYLSPEGRYSVVNCTGDRTVEIRAFKGTLNPVTLIACIEFAHASWHFARDMGPLSTERFLQFINRPEWRGSTGSLRAHLAMKGYPVYTPRPAPNAKAVEATAEA